MVHMGKMAPLKVCLSYEYSFTCGGVLASSVGMDKILMKDVYRANNIPVVKYIWFIEENGKKIEKGIKDVEAEIGYPIFVKPANLAPVLHKQAKDKEGLIEAIDIAVNYDRKIIIEKQ